MGFLGEKNNMEHKHSQGTVHSSQNSIVEILSYYTQLFLRGMEVWSGNSCRGLVIQKKYAVKLAPGESVKW